MDLSCEITRTCARVLHLTTGTFNLIVKDRIALRLSGAYSVQNEFPVWCGHSCPQPFWNKSACPRNLLNLVRALTDCQPIVPTGFPQTPGSFNQTWGALLQTAKRASALANPCLLTQAKAEDSSLRKDRLEVIATNAKPFEALWPRIRTPWPGSISEFILCL